MFQEEKQDWSSMFAWRVWRVKDVPLRWLTNSFVYQREPRPSEGAMYIPRLALRRCVVGALAFAQSNSDTLGSTDWCDL